MKTLWRVCFFVLLAIALAQAIALYLGRRALWEANVATANAKAKGDSTRTRLVGELAIAERLVIQKQVELDEALQRKGQTDQALVRIRLERDSLIARTPVAIVVPVADRPLELRAKFDGRDSLGIYVATLTTLEGVAVTRPDPVGWVRWEVVREPLQLDVALSCHGHDAVAQVAGPRWATIDIARVEQRPELCNPRPTWRPFSFEAPSLPIAGALLAGGWILRDLFAR